MDLEQVSACIAIREQILRGEWPSGSKVTTTALAAVLGRPALILDAALSCLVDEGLISRTSDDVYTVAPWSGEEAIDVIEIRGALEGLAARRVAERGASPEFLAELRACLRDGDEIFARTRLSLDDTAVYAAMNRRFHDLLAEESASPTLLEALSRNNRRPFASPFAIAFGLSDPQQAYDILRYAHRQHHAIIDALEKGQGARADVLMREHVSPARERLNLRHQRASQVPATRESFVRPRRGTSAASG